MMRLMRITDEPTAGGCGMIVREDMIDNISDLDL